MNHCIATNQRRRGLNSIEVLMAFTLLSAALSVVTPLVVRNGRLLMAQQDYRIALDELSNQLDRLQSLPADDLPAALEGVTPSDFAKAKLPGVELKGHIATTGDRSRLSVEIVWNETNRAAAPLRLAAWLPAEPATNMSEGDAQ